MLRTNMHPRLVQISSKYLLHLKVCIVRYVLVGSIFCLKFRMNKIDS